jgi:predicted DNA-binding transcriptional regulator AlpA
MTPVPTQSPVLRTDPAAKYCGSTKSTFEKYRLTGEGPAYIKLGRVVVYDIEDLNTWLTSHRRMSTSEQVAV